uniref:Uncharacterized protein n=1 Tax=Sphaerodactylus townsendi TaxID=933632 RepID=A0ACB8FHZ2_9SAUR
MAHTHIIMASYSEGKVVVPRPPPVALIHKPSKPERQASFNAAGILYFREMTAVVFRVNLALLKVPFEETSGAQLCRLKPLA